MQSAYEDFRIGKLYRAKAKWIGEQLNKEPDLSFEDKLAIGERALELFESGGQVNPITLIELVNEYMGR